MFFKVSDVQYVQTFKRSEFSNIQMFKLSKFELHFKVQKKQTFKGSLNKNFQTSAFKLSESQSLKIIDLDADRGPCHPI